MKKLIHSTIPALLLLSLLLGSFSTAQAAGVTPRYTGIASITSGLTISSTGKATCNGNSIIWDDYTADIAVELKQDGTTIKTWTSSGSEIVSAGGTYYVKSGHTYVVTTTVTVYDSTGNVLDTVSKDSLPKDY